jgi:hypothetical protein
MWFVTERKWILYFFTAQSGLEKDNNIVMMA